jgi:hypothetical protein
MFSIARASTSALKPQQDLVPFIDAGYAVLNSDTPSAGEFLDRCRAFRFWEREAAKAG